jgi:hypothetical protein
MKLANVALVSTMVVFGLVAAGCASKADGAGDDEGTLGTLESQLVEDNNEVDDEEETMDAGVDEPLSGADLSDPGSPADSTDDADLAMKIRTNPGKFFQPAGCLTTVLTGNVAKHTFVNCTGPAGLVNFNGTITSTYVRAIGSLTITHEATGFTVNGASISGKRVVVYTRSGTVITKHRTGAWSGTTKKGKTFSHDADFTATWNSATKCVTRDGSAQTKVADREFSRTITGFKRCGIGSFGCPQSGTIVLQRTKGESTASLTIEFTGGRGVTITSSGGRSVTRQLLCRVN